MPTTAHDPFAGPALAARLPLTEAQREVWLGAQIHEGANLAYNQAGTLSFKGSLDVPALLASLQTLVDRHESLRASFSQNGQWLVVRETLTLDIPVIDIAADPQRLLAEHEAAMAAEPFDLGATPLIRYRLLRVSADEHYLVRAAHHVIVDGWSSWVLSKELGELYSARVQGREAELPAPARYGDYAQVEQDFVASTEGQSHLDYWLKVLQDPPNRLPLPHDLPRPAERSYAAETFDFTLDPGLVGGLRKLGVSQGASLVATTLAAFSALLFRLSGADDLIVGLAAAGQSFHSQPNLVGHAVNLLPLRLKPRGEMPFTALMAATRDTVLDAFDHQGASFGTIVPRLRFERDAARPPLVPIMFNIDVRSGDVQFAGLATAYRSLPRPAEIFELFVNLVDDGKSLVLECTYNSALFSAGAMRARMGEFETLLKAVCVAPETTLAQLPIMTDGDRAAWQALNATALPMTLTPVHAGIAAQAAATPTAIALRFGELTLDYATLEARASNIAAVLTAAGAGPGRLVGICLERKPELIAALLAVLKTGAAYLPLDPEFPAERLAYYLQDSGAALVLADARAKPRMDSANCPVLLLEELVPAAPFVPPPVTATDSAYVIYTSGSTGKPKGVVVPHGALSNFLASMAKEPGLSASDVLAAVTTVSFDIAALEVWLPLTVGACVVLIDRDTAIDGERLKTALLEQGVTVMQATPSTWRLLLASGWTGDARRFRALSGGEPLPRELAEQLLPKVQQLWNLYGPTETTVWSTVQRVVDTAAPMLIGHPIANTQCHVLDAFGAVLPPGVTGTLHIGGAGLASGYHARPELTAERFVEHPEFGRLYDTGDLARLADGGLECLGREDHQVKLRGYRIEPGEIEYALSRHAAVAESAVLIRERSAGDARLIAYVVLRPDAQATASELRNAVRGFLPAYMLPQDFVMLDALPRLANGKLDRKALPDAFAGSQPKPNREPPATAAEQQLAALWVEMLKLPGIESVARDDRFFDLGGHSLLAVQLAGRIAKTTGTRPPLRALMMDPLSVAAGLLGGAQGAENAVTPPPLRTTAGPGNSTANAADIVIPARTPVDTARKQSWLRKLFGD